MSLTTRKRIYAWLLLISLTLAFGLLDGVHHQLFSTGTFLVMMGGLILILFIMGSRLRLQQ